MAIYETLRRFVGRDKEAQRGGKIEMLKKMDF